MKKRQSLIFLVVLLLLTIPTFVRMIRPGLYSMQDFPYFRVVEYAKCFTDFQIPCRWAPDAGLGYGEPVFSFYSQVPFFVGAVVSMIGFSFEFATKAVFAISLVASAVSMYFFAKKVWGDKWAAVVCSLLYLYAPYRAVNVWVRGALPEAFAFVLIPLILLLFEIFLEKKRRIFAIYFSISLALLVLTHNLSVILYAHLIGSWIIVRLVQTKNYKLIRPLFFSAVLAICLSAFYLLPTVLESRYVTISQITQGYFNFRAHFVTIPQLFLSRFWGYGGSTWGEEDGLSLAIGQVQWIIAFGVLALSVFLYFKNKLKNAWGYLPVHLVLTGLFYLLLTHNKSAPLWEALSPIMGYIQFPWRFLGPALFSFSLAAGFLVTQMPKVRYLPIVIAALVILANISFFREDIWFNKPDEYFLTGEMWDTSKVASIGDYWTVYGPIPKGDESFPGIAKVTSTSSSQRYLVSVDTPQQLSFPIMYFPGWSAYIDNATVPVTHDDHGFISVPFERNGQIDFEFRDTNTRQLANVISLLAIISILCMIKYDIYTERLKKS